VSLYNYSNITYPSGLWSFSYASKTVDPNAKLREETFLNNLKYYNHEIHRAAFCLPQFQKQALKELFK
jgi:spermidine synthase